MPMFQQFRSHNSWGQCGEAFLLNSSDKTPESVNTKSVSLNIREKSLCQYSHVSVWSRACVCVFKQDEKGKCAVIGTCGQQKELNFQSSI